MGAMRVMGAALLTLTAVAPASALPVEAGPSITIEAPSTYTPGIPITVSGALSVVFALPIVVEVAQPIPDQRVEITVNGAVAATAVTGADGRYVAALTFDAALPHTKQLQAIAFRDAPLETRSRTTHSTIDRVLSDLTVSPSDVELSAGGEAQLLAEGLWHDGRTEDLTDEAAWTSSDESVATVEAGRVVAHAAGEAQVTASYRGRSATAAVTVVPA